MDDILIEKDTTLSMDENIGKEFLFSNGDLSNKQIYKFASQIENIGLIFDRELKNNTIVIALSGMVDAYHPIVGDIKVVKVFYFKSMWVKADHLHKIESK